jgi:uncharacterized phage protein (TIGR02218 family)
MKSASAGLIALLNSAQQFRMVDLYTFALVGGYVARYSAMEGALSVAGNVFDGNGPIITRSRTRSLIGIEIDTLDVTVAATAAHLLNGSPWLSAARHGALDGATVQLERLFMPSWGDVSLGTVLLFKGRVAELECGRTAVRLRVNSALELLNTMMPRNLYEPGCPNTLFDGACTLSKAAWGSAATVASATPTVLNCGLSQAAGWFDLGTVTFTSGINNGVSRSVKSYTPGVVNLMAPLVTAPSPGDTFIAYAGCDKQQATCRDRFGNLPNFRGHPYVPAPESVL